MTTHVARRWSRPPWRAPWPDRGSTPRPPLVDTVLRPTRHELRRRLPQLLFGLGIISVGISMTVRADLGLAPYEVLNQGVSRQTPLSFGQASIVFGLGVLVLWWPLRQVPGVGTVVNIIGVGLAIDALLATLPTPHGLAYRGLWLAIGVVLVGWGIGLYIGAGLGPGPRDGVMTGLARRGAPVWLVRLLMELTALGVGFLLGGTVGIGTVAFALGVPVLADLSLRRHSIHRPKAPPVPDPCGTT